MASIRADRWQFGILLSHRRAARSFSAGSRRGDSAGIIGTATGLGGGRARLRWTRDN